MDVGLDSIWPKCEHSRRKNRIERSASSEMLSEQSAAHPSIAKIRTQHIGHGWAEGPKGPRNLSTLLTVTTVNSGKASYFYFYSS